MAVGWGLVGKHVGEENKRAASLSETEISSLQGVVEEGAQTFRIRKGNI